MSRASEVGTDVGSVVEVEASGADVWDTAEDEVGATGDAGTVEAHPPARRPNARRNTAGAATSPETLRRSFIQASILDFDHPTPAAVSASLDAETAFVPSSLRPSSSRRRTGSPTRRREWDGRRDEEAKQSSASLGAAGNQNALRITPGGVHTFKSGGEPGRT